jgi:hypothetical protein
MKINDIAKREPVNALYVVLQAAGLWRECETIASLHATADGASVETAIGEGWYRLTCVPFDPPKKDHIGLINITKMPPVGTMFMATDCAWTVLLVRESRIIFAVEPDDRPMSSTTMDVTQWNLDCAPRVVRLSQLSAKTPTASR